MSLSYGKKLAEAREWQYPPDTLFRVEAVSYSYTVDADREEYGSTTPALEVFDFDVRNWTTYGATLDVYSGARRKWVDLRPGARQWASRTVEEAVQQLQARRKRQMFVLRRQMQRAQWEHDLCEAYLTGTPIGLLAS